MVMIAHKVGISLMNSVLHKEQMAVRLLEEEEAERLLDLPTLLDDFVRDHPDRRVRHPVRVRRRQPDLLHQHLRG